MNPTYSEAREYIANAREALQKGDMDSALHWGRQAAQAAPRMEDPWLVLAASDPDPRTAHSYARQALKINPKSSRAQRAVEWTLTRVKQAPVNRKPRVAAHGNPPEPEPLSKPSRKTWLYPTLVLGVACLIVAFVGLFAATRPALAYIVDSVNVPVPTQENLWAPAKIAKPTITPIDSSVFAPQRQDSPTSTWPESTNTVPAFTPTDAPALVPEATQTPGTLTMELVDENSVLPSAPNQADVRYPAASNGQRWIEVNLSEQRVYAYEGDTIVNSFLVSTGVEATPTVTGEYRIYVKVRIQDMSGPGYYLPDVPWIMYFYEGYGFHGTYWHNNFGTPMSRGCVNMRIEDAAWLYDWASVGTLVNIHY